MSALRIFALAALVAAAAALSAVLYLNAPGRNPPVVAAGGPFGAPFALIDHNGQPVSEAIFRDRPAVVMFGFTACPDVCPATLGQMQAWSQALGGAGKDLRYVFVSVDPERDTPGVLKDYLSVFEVPVTGITGAPQAVAGMLASHYIYSEKVPLEGGDYTMDHSASVFLLNSRGELFGTISPDENRDAALAKLRRLAGQG